jgi:hypothetical protein
MSTLCQFIYSYQSAAQYSAVSKGLRSTTVTAGWIDIAFHIGNQWKNVKSMGGPMPIVGYQQISYKLSLDGCLPQSLQNETE